MPPTNSFKHKTPVEVRFVDIDAFGHVNNANFLTYFEQARIAYFNIVAGWNYDWSKKGVIVARNEINYILPVRFGDKLIVYTNCSRLGNKSFDIQYRIFKVPSLPDGGSGKKDEEEQLVADGITVMVAFNYEEGKAIEIPAEWKEAIERFEAAE